MADNWLEINSSNLYDLCGWTQDIGYWITTLENALDGLAYWAHKVGHTHWFILDLGDIYTIKWVSGRSEAITGDPTQVSVFVSDYDTFNWILVRNFITGWYDTRNWVQYDCVDIHGRYVLVEVYYTEDPGSWIYWGNAYYNSYDHF